MLSQCLLLLPNAFLVNLRLYIVICRILHRFNLLFFLLLLFLGWLGLVRARVVRTRVHGHCELHATRLAALQRLRWKLGSFLVRYLIQFEHFLRVAEVILIVQRSRTREFFFLLQVLVLHGYIIESLLF